MFGTFGAGYREVVKVPTGREDGSPPQAVSSLAHRAPPAIGPDRSAAHRHRPDRAPLTEQNQHGARQHIEPMGDEAGATRVIQTRHQPGHDPGALQGLPQKHRTGIYGETLRAALRKDCGLTKWFNEVVNRSSVSPMAWRSALCGTSFNY